MKNIIYLKYSLIVFLILIVTLTLPCCSSSKDESIMPDDFYFIMEGDVDLLSEYFVNKPRQLLDTKNKILRKESEDGIAEIAYNISHNDLNGIYNNIIKYKVKDLSRDAIYRHEHGSCDPNFQHRFTFQINGNIYSIVFDSSLIFFEDKKMTDLNEFFLYIVNFYQSTDEYKNLPEPSGGYY